MASYPVNDDESLQGAVNDLLSGPGGLGQNFQGVSSSDPAFIRPTFRGPFLLPITTTLDPSWYVDIPIGNCVGVDDDTFQVTFSSAQSSAPFQFGDRVGIKNVVTDAGGTEFNGYPWYVLDSTTTGANLYFPDGQYQPWANYVSGGNVVRDFNNEGVTADNNARVTIFGPTDQAFITSQIRLDVDYITSGNADFRVKNTIERWRGYPIQGTEDYTFALDEIISEQSEDFSVTSSGSVPVEAIFTTVLDDPGFGYYWYFNNIYFLNKGGLLDNTTSSNFDFREYSVVGTSPRPANNTYPSTNFITVTGTGSGAAGNVVIYNTPANNDVIITDGVDSSNINITLTVTSPGNGYVIGDMIKILGNAVGGNTPADDIILKINQLTTTDPITCYAGNVVVGFRSFTAQVIKQ